VRDASQQKQDINDLSRDTENANGHIDKIFDKDKIEKNQALTQAVGDLAVQTMQYIGMQVKINATQDALSRMSKSEVDAFNNAEPEAQQAILEKDPQYKAAQEKYGIGSTFWTAGTAISGALAGLAGGDMNQALAGGLAPYLALAVKKAAGDNHAANITGHALAGAVVAYLQGGSVAGGAAGAVEGELAAKIIADQLYPNRDPSTLTNDEKSNVSALSTLAAGLAGGVAGNSLNAAGTGAVNGKVTVENNIMVYGTIAEMLAYHTAQTAGAASAESSKGENKDAALALDKAVDQFGKSVIQECLKGGSCPVAAVVILGSIAGMVGEEPSSQPNIGKTLTNAEKAELGGLGGPLRGAP